MDEQQGPDPTESATPALEETGVESVDRVLVEIASLEGRPVADHVAAYERAHDQLRRALDAPQES